MAEVTLIRPPTADHDPFESPEARRERIRRKQRLTRAAKNPGLALERGWHHDPKLTAGLLDCAEQQAFGCEPDALEVAHRLVEVAERSGDPHLYNRSVGVMAAAYMARWDRYWAGKTLELHKPRILECCPDCRSEHFRREGDLLAELRQVAASLEAFGHAFDERGGASPPTTAAASASPAPSATTSRRPQPRPRRPRPDAPPHLPRVAPGLLRRHPGDGRDLRPRRRPVPRPPGSDDDRGARGADQGRRLARSRTRLRWVKGLLHARLGHFRRARRGLKAAHRRLLKRGLAREAVAASLDLAQLAVRHWDLTERAPGGRPGGDHRLPRRARTSGATTKSSSRGCATRCSSSIPTRPFACSGSSAARSSPRCPTGSTSGSSGDRFARRCRVTARAPPSGCSTACPGSRRAGGSSPARTARRASCGPASASSEGWIPAEVRQDFDPERLRPRRPARPGSTSATSGPTSTTAAARRRTSTTTAGRGSRPAGRRRAALRRRPIAWRPAPPPELGLVAVRWGGRPIVSGHEWGSTGLRRSDTYVAAFLQLRPRRRPGARPALRGVDGLRRGRLGSRDPRRRGAPDLRRRPTRSGGRGTSRPRTSSTTPASTCASSPPSRPRANEGAGYVDRQPYRRMIQAFERAGIRTEHPHASHLYDALAGKSWQHSLCLDPALRVPAGLAVARGDVESDLEGTVRDCLAGLEAVRRAQHRRGLVPVGMDARRRGPGRRVALRGRARGGEARLQLGGARRQALARRRGPARRPLRPDP